MKIYQQIIRPTLVLVLIASLVAAALALTYNLAGVEKVANAGYTPEQLAEYAAVALPEADTLTQKTVTPSTEEMEDSLLYVYTADNGAGTALVVVSKGYASDGITMMVGLDTEGQPVGVKVIKNAETPGIGDKVCANEEFHQQVADTIREGGEPDVIAGATKSSNGIIGGVRTAVSIYQTLEKEGALA